MANDKKATFTDLAAKRAADKLVATAREAEARKLRETRRALANGRGALLGYLTFGKNPHRRGWCPL